MTATVPRPTAFALVALALGLALAALTLAHPERAAAAHGDCTLVNEGPASFYGVDVITSGSVECASAKNTIRFTILLTMDGSVVASGDRTCHKAASCWSYLTADDPPGDQLWCTRVSARVGSHSLAAITRCEADPAL